MTQVDSNVIKQQAKEMWGKAAEGWRRHDAELRKLTIPVTERMLKLAGIAPGQRVLDIACGTGEPAIPAAQTVGAAGNVLATDQAPEMLEIAREKAKAQGVTNIEFRQVDGEEIDVPAESFDAVTCRFGVMFMPEPVRCLQQAHQALKPGGKMLVATWGPPQNCPFISLPMVILRKHYTGPALPADPMAPGSVFSFASEDRLRDVFQEAGFREVSTEALDLPMAVFGSGQEFFDFQMDMAGPLKAVFSQMSPDEQEAARNEIIQAAPQGRADGSVSLNGQALITSATK